MKKGLEWRRLDFILYKPYRYWHYIDFVLYEEGIKMEIGMLKILRGAGILSVVANIILIILKFVLKIDIQSTALIINVVVTMIVLILGYSGILKINI